MALQGLIGMLLLGGAIEYLGSSLDNMMTVEGTRFVLLLIITLVTSLILVLIAMSTPFILIKMTKLYEEYTRGEVPEIQGHKSRLTPLLWLSAPAIPALCVLFSWVGTLNFDAIFPQTYDVKVIAHRACGNEGYENTAEGLATAEAAGAWGAEIDIQRTADGAYVVNHDDIFARVAGDSHKPSELTLEQVRQLKVTANPADPTGPGVPVSTYEEMLDGALAHNLVLFVELKGATADHQMVDDAVRIARERGALDNCVFISLKYDLIDYLEKNYHDVKGGYLAFGSYGETQNLNCDYLALEEQATSPLLIANVHDAGKSYLVWTVNTEEEQEKFLCTGADAIITDNITQAARIKDEINHRGDVERVMSVVGTWF